MRLTNIPGGLNSILIIDLHWFEPIFFQSSIYLGEVFGFFRFHLDSQTFASHHCVDSWFEGFSLLWPSFKLVDLIWCCSWFCWLLSIRASHFLFFLQRGSSCLILFVTLRGSFFPSVFWKLWSSFLLLLVSSWLFYISLFLIFVWSVDAGVPCVDVNKGLNSFLCLLAWLNCFSCLSSISLFSLWIVLV